MKCHHCHQFDSLLTKVYVDKNNHLVTQSERTAFEILHPEAKGAFYGEVLLCGICYQQLTNQKNVTVKVQKRASFKKNASGGKPDHFYICPKCKTENEPLRNTCKKCRQVLFSTEYETRRVPAQTVRGKPFNRKMIMIPIVAALAVAFMMGGRKGDNPQMGAPATLSIQDQVLSGQSNYEWPDGTKYTGDFKAGQPHGKGTIVWTSGNTYTGDFIQGQITGNGTLDLADGATYIGSFYNGQPHGKGTMYFPDGSVYNGNWVNGERE